MAKRGKYWDSWTQSHLPDPPPPPKINMGRPTPRTPIKAAPASAYAGWTSPAERESKKVAAEERKALASLKKQERKLRRMARPKRRKPRLSRALRRRRRRR